MTCVGVARAADSRDGVGAAAGYARGVGFSYLHHTVEGWAVGGVALGLTINGGFAYNLGATVQRTLSGGSQQRLYAGATGAVIRRIPDSRIGYTDTNIGIALGVERMLSPEMGASLEVCEAWITRHGDVILTPALALHYYF
jgi:hypothetical protein